jgi:type IV pilus assembly protein PilA
MTSASPRASALSITALVLACLVILPFVPLVGGILGIVALVRRRPDQGGKGLAIAAIAVGFAGFFLIQGILAAVAIPAFMTYMKKSKSTEAQHILKRLERGVRSRFHDRSEVPVATTDWTPAGSCCAQPGQRCRPEPGPWAEAPWSDLGFELSDPHRYQVRYQSDGQRVTLAARGDLDCDGTFSHFEVAGRISEGEPTFEPIRSEQPDE